MAQRNGQGLRMNGDEFHKGIQIFLALRLNLNLTGSAFCSGALQRIGEISKPTINMKAKTASHLMILFSSLILVGCNTPSSVSSQKAVKNPMHASLDWLTAEAGPVKIENDLPTWQKLTLSLEFIPYNVLGIGYILPWRWEQRSLVSVGGDLPMPLIGDAYYWPEGSSPVTALRVFQPKQCSWLEGTVEPTNVDYIFQGKTDLEILQRQASRALELALEESRLDLSDTNKNDVVISNRLCQVRNQLTDLADKMDMARSNLSVSLNHGGIVVFRWEKKNETGGGIAAGDYGSTNGKKKDAETGFAILNGIKVKSLTIDTNWIQNYEEIQKAKGFKFIRQIGVTTYLKQARDVVYVRDMETLRAFSAQADISKIIKDIYGPKLTADTFVRLQLALSIYHSAVAELATFGAMTNIKWRQRNYANSTERDAELANSWSTIYAVLTDPKGLSSEIPDTHKIDITFFGNNISREPAAKN